jgi:CheY-like chemotaxis protein
MVVEDDEDILEVVKFLLEAKGFNVFEHTSGLEVLDGVEKYQSDLILVDIGLPENQEPKCVKN